MGNHKLNPDKVFLSIRLMVYPRNRPRRLSIRDDRGHHPRFLLLNDDHEAQSSYYFQFEINPSNLPGLGTSVIEGRERRFNFRCTDSASFECATLLQCWYADNPSKIFGVEVARHEGRLSGLKLIIGPNNVYLFDLQEFDFNWELHQMDSSGIYNTIEAFEF